MPHRPCITPFQDRQIPVREIIISLQRLRFPQRELHRLPPHDCKAHADRCRGHDGRERVEHPPACVAGVRFGLGLREVALSHVLRAADYVGYECAACEPPGCAAVEEGLCQGPEGHVLEW